MLRALLVSLGLLLVFMWMVAVVEDATTWLTWVDGGLALLAVLAATALRDDRGPVRASAPPGAVGVALLAAFIAGLATGATSWLTWFTFAAAAGALGVAAMTLVVKVLEPRLHTRRSIAAQ